MITFNKKMVKGIIDLITSEPCKNRPILQTLRIQRDGYGYITNGYMAIRFKFETEVVPLDENQKEFVIPAGELLYWYHNAKASDYLNELTIIDLQTTKDIGQYPDIAYLFQEKLKTVPFTKTEHRFDDKLLELFCKCAGSTLVELKATSDGEYVKSIQDDNLIDAIIMEIRK